MHQQTFTLPIMLNYGLTPNPLNKCVSNVHRGLTMPMGAFVMMLPDVTFTGGHASWWGHSWLLLGRSALVWWPESIWHKCLVRWRTCDPTFHYTVIRVHNGYFNSLYKRLFLNHTSLSNLPLSALFFLFCSLWSVMWWVSVENMLSPTGSMTRLVFHFFEWLRIKPGVAHPNCGLMQLV